DGFGRERRSDRQEDVDDCPQDGDPARESYRSTSASDEVGQGWGWDRFGWRVVKPRRAGTVRKMSRSGSGALVGPATAQPIARQWRRKPPSAAQAKANVRSHRLPVARLLERVGRAVDRR